MKTTKFDTWVNKILATEDEEISCSQCFDYLAEVVEAEVLHRPAPETYARVKQHLHQCQVCQEEYETLRDLAQIDRAGNESPAEK